MLDKFYILVPRDLKCHKCGSSEPWKDAIPEYSPCALAEKYPERRTVADCRTQVIAGQINACAACMVHKPTTETNK